jgi:hypothetical protein
MTSDYQRKIVEFEELLNLVRRNHHITIESLDQQTLDGFRDPHAVPVG